uniref:Similar to IBR3 (IBA-RESPONSE 3) n=1 Tax=Arundo donax TaxID=35708 RepID=A0A0A9DLV6_ARUDO
MRRRCCATRPRMSRGSPRRRRRWLSPSSATASRTPPTASGPPRPGARPGATCCGRSRPGPSSSRRTPSSASSRFSKLWVLTQKFLSQRFIVFAQMQV